MLIFKSLARVKENQQRLKDKMKAARDGSKAKSKLHSGRASARVGSSYKKTHQKPAAKPVFEAKRSSQIVASNVEEATQEPKAVTDKKPKRPMSAAKKQTKSTQRLTQPNAATLAKQSHKKDFAKTQSQLNFASPTQKHKRMATTGKKPKKHEEQETQASQLQGTLKKDDDLPMSDIFASPVPVTNKKILLDSDEFAQQQMSPQPIQPNPDEQLRSQQELKAF